ncbi:MAG: hypothetical protein QM644_07965 [Mobilitalea sp.]
MKNFISKLKESFKNGGMKKMFMTFALVLTMCVVTLNTAAVAYAGTTNLSKLEENLGLEENGAENTSNMLGNIISIIAMLARVVGVLLGVYGLYKLIVAFKDQDANGITQGIVLLAVGIILIMFKTIVNAVFNITVS